jgi:hypothetical protein
MGEGKKRENLKCKWPESRSANAQSAPSPEPGRISAAVAQKTIEPESRLPTSQARPASAVAPGGQQTWKKM